jgi:hypothetical protein
MRTFALISAVVVAYLIYHLLTVMQSSVTAAFAHIG